LCCAFDKEEYLNFRETLLVLGLVYTGQ
jgi:hypothetical protein